MADPDFKHCQDSLDKQRQKVRPDREKTPGFKKCEDALVRFGIVPDIGFAATISDGLTIILIEKLEEVSKKLDKIQIIQ